jgi:hypothetical protein
LRTSKTFDSAAPKRGQVFIGKYTRIFVHQKPIRADLRRLADSFCACEKPPRLTAMMPDLWGLWLFVVK